MNKLSALLAFFALAFAQFTFANAVVTHVEGAVSVQTGTSPARTLRLGDSVYQGDTISTAAGSEVVLKFDDGQVAGLTGKSKMTVTTYRFDRAKGSGKVMLSLIEGGMQAVTGGIGKNRPQDVSYRVGTATIDVLGTDVVMVVNGENIVVSVNNGNIRFTHKGTSYELPVGRAIFVGKSSVTTGAVYRILANVSNEYGLLGEMLRAFGNVSPLLKAVVSAAYGDGYSGKFMTETRDGVTVSIGTPPGGSGGGGPASPSRP